jgi:hypothetical protein
MLMAADQSVASTVLGQMGQDRAGEIIVKLTAAPDDAANVHLFREGDLVRSRDDDDNCVVLGIWRDWLWLDPVDYRDAAPFTGRAADYELVRRG